MRRTTATFLLLAMATIGTGCGNQAGPPAPDGTVQAWLDALAAGDAAPLVEALDFREHYAALPATEREITTFEAFVAAFREASAHRAGGVYVVGESEHQIVGHYDDAERTMVKVRFRRGPTVSWQEWDLPLRFIDGAWRMGLGGLDALDGASTPAGHLPPPRSDLAPLPVRPAALEPGPDVVETPPALPIPLPESVSVVAPPARPAVDEAEKAELELLRRFLAAGGDVNARLGDGELLGWPAHGHRRLHVAAQQGWAKVATLLLEHGADPNAVAQTKSHYNDVTPADVARHAKQAKLLALLERTQREDREAAKTLELVFPNPRRAAALVALDEGRIYLVTRDMKGREVSDDLWIEPGDPEIQALTRDFDGLKHRGADAAVARWDLGFGGLRRAPATPAWKRTLPRSFIREDAVFLVRSSSGRIYKVQLQQCDTRAVKLRYAPLPSPPRAR